MLLDNAMVQEDEEQIANFLMATEGINKDVLGKFFGSPKERNQKI